MITNLKINKIFYFIKLSFYNILNNNIFNKY